MLRYAVCGHEWQREKPSFLAVDISVRRKQGHHHGVPQIVGERLTARLELRHGTSRSISAFNCAHRILWGPQRTIDDSLCYITGTSVEHVVTYRTPRHVQPWHSPRHGLFRYTGLRKVGLGIAYHVPISCHSKHIFSQPTRDTPLVPGNLGEATIPHLESVERGGRLT